jgi:hypothetical protein
MGLMTNLQFSAQKFSVEHSMGFSAHAHR